jgi:hypothetical protein
MGDLLKAPIELEIMSLNVRRKTARFSRWPTPLSGV